VVGYVNTVYNGLFTLTANPLNATSNTLNGVLSTAPLGSKFFKFDEIQNQWLFSSTKLPAGWNINLTLNPGEGGFLSLAGSPTVPVFTNTYVGEVMQGHLVNPISASLVVRSSMVPQEGNLNDLELTPFVSAGAKVFRWDRDGSQGALQSYYSTTRLPIAGNWVPLRTINVGEAFIVNSTNFPVNWTRDFTVQ
jgi:hypothetical protein